MSNQATGDRRMEKWPRGFTLVEVMVVLVLVGIMTTAAVSGYQSLVQGVRVKTASQDLFSSLLLARSEAVKRNANVTVTPVGGGWAEGWEILSGEELILRQPQLKGVAVTKTPDAVTYARNGRLLSGASMPQFQIAASVSVGASAQCIIIDLSGRPRSFHGEC